MLQAQLWSIFSWSYALIPCNNMRQEHENTSVTSSRGRCQRVLFETSIQYFMIMTRCFSLVCSASMQVLQFYTKMHRRSSRWNLEKQKYTVQIEKYKYTICNYLKTGFSYSRATTCRAWFNSISIAMSGHSPELLSCSVVECACDQWGFHWAWVWSLPHLQQEAPSLEYGYSNPAQRSPHHPSKLVLLSWQT